MYLIKLYNLIRWFWHRFGEVERRLLIPAFITRIPYLDRTMTIQQILHYPIAFMWYCAPHIVSHLVFRMFILNHRLIMTPGLCYLERNVILKSLFNYVRSIKTTFQNKDLTVTLCAYSLDPGGQYWYVTSIKNYLLC